ncbi:MAG: hypothetical protein ACC661_11480, partial [Verrucomicrobiales bacterium]
ALSTDQKIRFAGGELHMGRLSGYRLDAAELYLEEGRLRLESAVFIAGSEGQSGFEERSRLEVSGELELEGAGEARADLKVSGIEIEPFLPPSLRNRLEGTLLGTFAWTGRLNRPESGANLEGKCVLERAALDNLVVLEDLARYSGDSRFRRIEFPEGMRARLSSNGRALTLEGIHAEKPGLLKLEGRIAMSAAGDLEGELNLGLPEAGFLLFPGGKPAFFGAAQKGFSFAAMTVSGSADRFEEDLAGRLLASASGKSGGADAKARAEGAVGAAGGAKKEDSASEGAPTAEKRRAEALFRALLK